MAQVFGQYMEWDRVQQAALDVDEKAINEFDLGFTFAETATSIKLGVRPERRVRLGEEQELPNCPVGHGVRMSKKELAELEAQEEADEFENYTVIVLAYLLAA
jgi:hypothetical protein